MKKLFIAIFAVLFCGGLFAQEEFVTPDYDLIKRVSNDKNSEYCYSKLAKRFAQADTTLGLAELQAFYYGYAFQPSYSGYPHYSQFDKIRATLGQDEMPTEKDLQEIVSLSNEVIKECPSEPMAYLYKYDGLSLLAEHYEGDTAEAQKVKLQFQMLFYTIASTGNGLGPDAAMHVVTTAHEYMMMNMYGFRPKSQWLTFIEGHAYDIMEIDSNEYNVDSLYFNIDCIEASWGKMFGGAEKDVKQENVTSVEITMNTKFELELVKTKKKNSVVSVVKTMPISDTLVANDSVLFAEPIVENHVVGYFCKARLYEGSDHVSTCLILKSNSTEPMLYMNTEIAYPNRPVYHATSNSGIMKGVMMNEIWADELSSIKISNIRTRE